MNSLPKDPVMLLSFVNTQLRDNYPTLEALADAYEVSSAELISKLEGIDYHYNAQLNQFK